MVLATFRMSPDAVAQHALLDYEQVMLKLRTYQQTRASTAPGNYLLRLIQVEGYQGRGRCPTGIFSLQTGYLSQM